MRPESKHRTHYGRQGQGELGYSLVELLVVVAIIAILSSVALPSLAGFTKGYRLKSAGQEIAGEIHRARQAAIARNVNLGVVFVTESAESYRFVVEDAVSLVRSSVRPSLADLLSDPRLSRQLGPLRTLPRGVQFVACATGDLDAGFRFDRLGAWKKPGTSMNSPSLTAGIPLVSNDSTGAHVCVVDPSTGLRQQIDVSPGGQVWLRS